MRLLGYNRPMKSTQKSKKRALITGATGQDGAYLSRFLLNKGYEVFGTTRRSSSPNLWRLQYVDVLDKINIVPADLTDMSSLMEAVEISDPDEVYNLAAQSFVGASFENPLMTGKVDGLAPIMLLESIRLHKPSAKFYQASTSELYGKNGVKGAKLSETSPFWPNSPYAAAKQLAFHTVNIYREAYGLYAVNGILFNHESPLRGLEFVTRKISNAVARIKLGMQKDLHLGNMYAMRDWGFAEEYVEAMWLMLQQDKPEDYVIATGESHSVEEFVNEAFEIAGLDPKKYVKTDKSYMRPLEVNCLLGDSRKANKELGWKPKTKFKHLVRLMVETDIERWEMYKKGEIFPWDAPNYPDDISIKYISRSLRS